VIKSSFDAIGFIHLRENGYKYWSLRESSLLLFEDVFSAIIYYMD